MILLLVEAKRFDMVIYGCVGVYAVFILALMGIETYLDQETLAIMDHVDSVFLVIMLRTIAHGRWYVCDIWNLFDATVVIASAVFKLLNQQSKSVSLLRLLRLLRLVLVLRKVNAGKK